MANKAVWLAAGLSAAFAIVVVGGVLAGIGAARTGAAQASAQTTAAQGSTGLTAERAAMIALQSAPGAALQGMPDLVRYQGRLAYEAPMDRGMVYVDAQSGAILANTAKAAPVIAAGAVNPPSSTANQGQAASPSFSGSFRPESREGGSRDYRTHREHDDDDD